MEIMFGGDSLFEDNLGILIGDVVSYCLLCVNGIDNVYIYMNFVKEDVYVDFFFSIDGKIIEKSFVFGEDSDEVGDINYYVLKKGEEIKRVFKEFNKNTPFEIKISYNILMEKLNIDSNYIDYMDAKCNPGIYKWIDVLVEYTNFI